MILYFKDTKNSTQNLLDTINNFNNVAGDKINLEKSITFLYTNYEQIEKEYKKKNSIYSSLKKKIKYLRVSLTYNVNDHCKENNKPLKKEIEEDFRRWQISLAHGLVESTWYKWLY
jgi:predicted RNase H-like nuclease (RuvC/YqgF family)